uniref:Uncharacterized protein n=1 Tax=Oryza nivara TaxID=4536 RepID=A0A0E0IMW0_ORYNI
MTPIATTFVWPVPPRGWTVSPATGRYRFGYGYGGASSSSTAPAAPTITRGPTPLLLLAVPPVPAPLVPAPPAPTPHLFVPRGGWTVSPTTGNDRFGDGGVSSSTAAPLTPIAHSAPPETTPYVPALPMPTPSTVALVGLTVSPTNARYSFSYGGASSSSATPRAPTASLALRAPPHLRAPCGLAPPVPTPPALATHVPMPPAPAPPVPTPPAPTPPADVPPRFTVSLTTIRHNFGYDGASSSFATPRMRTISLALRAPAPHLRAPRTLAPPAPTPPTPATPVPMPPTPTRLVPTPPAPGPPADVPPGFTVSPTTTRPSFGYDGASSLSATPRMHTTSLALRALAPHLRVTRVRSYCSYTALHTPPVTAPPATAPPMIAPPVATPPDSASSPSTVPRMPSAPLALRALAPHLRALRVSVPHPRASSAPAPPVAAPRGWTVSPTTARYSFSDSGASSSSAAPRASTAPLALHAPAPHLRAPPVATPPPAAPRGWTMPTTIGRYSFSYGGVSLSYAMPCAPTAPLSLRLPSPHLRARRAPTSPPAAATPCEPTPPAAAAAAPAAPPALPSGLPSWPVLVRPPTGPARARLVPAAPAGAFEEYLVQRRAIEATVDDTPWEMIGSSRRTGGPMFAVAGGGRDRVELEARERRKNRMDKSKTAAASRAQQPPPPADAPGSSGGGIKKRGGGMKKKQA